MKTLNTVLGGITLAVIAGYSFIAGHCAGRAKCYREDVQPRIDLLNKFALRGWGEENVDRLPSAKDAALNAPRMKAIVAIDSDKAVLQEVVDRKRFDEMFGLEGKRGGCCRYIDGKGTCAPR